MKMLLVAIAVLSASAARASEIIITLSDQEKQALIDLLDVATKAQGLNVAQTTLYFANKIKTAPIVTGKTEDKPAEEQKK